MATIGVENEQRMQWLTAQKILISEDLVVAAKQQLEFLAAVDRCRWLYDGPLLERAIYRYKAFWLPLLAKYTESGATESSLFVPLDCEWIWHCHRLNPVQYKKDCQKNFGRILDQQNVKSSLQGEMKYEMSELWNTMYPEEPFELKFDTTSCKTSLNQKLGANESITYDLISAVKRQSSFFYQVSRPSMLDNRFLEAALARYKGFLHLIKLNNVKSAKSFCVPTYDVDLMWHSHQLKPVSYCNDMMRLLGGLLEHDDTDSDRTKGKKLDISFTQTAKQWEDTYGIPYLKAGAMYRGSMPSPLTVTPYFSDSETLKKSINNKCLDITLTKTMMVEVLLEVVGVRNLPDTADGDLYINYGKDQPDFFLRGDYTLGVLSKSSGKQIAGFICEPTGELRLALMSKSDSNLMKTIGTTSISLDNLAHPDSELSAEKWFEFKPHNGSLESTPVCVHLAVSFTVPCAAPYQLLMVKSEPLSANTCFVQIPSNEQISGEWTHFLDYNGEEVVSLKMRNSMKNEEKHKPNEDMEVLALTRHLSKPHLIAHSLESIWSLIGSNMSFNVKKISNHDGHLLDIEGDRQVKLFLGQMLEYEPRSCQEKNGNEFITAIEFSSEHPCGKAVALFDMKSGQIKVNEEWFVLPGIILALIIKDMIENERLDILDRKKEIAQVTTGSNTDDISWLALLVAATQAGNNGSGCGSCVGVKYLKTEGILSSKQGGGCGGGSSCGGGCGGNGGVLSLSCLGGGGCGGCTGKYHEGIACRKTTNGGSCGGSCGGGMLSSGCGGKIRKGVAGANCAGCRGGVFSSGCGGGGCGGGKCGGMLSGNCGGCTGRIREGGNYAGCGGGGGCGGGCSGKIRKVVEGGNCAGCSGSVISSGCGGGGCGGGCGGHGGIAEA